MLKQGRLSCLEIVKEKVSLNIRLWNYKEILDINLSDKYGKTDSFNEDWVKKLQLTTLEINIIRYAKEQNKNVSNLR